MAAHPYLLSNAATQAGDRFSALSALYDAGTFASFEQAGIASGWRCWEAGAGGPSVLAGLVERVAPGGHVLATDIDINWLGQGKLTFDIRQHDVAADAPPAQDFDLAHARLVLGHVPARDRALCNMAASLKSGGWLIIEDFACTLVPQACLDPQTEDQHRANRIRAGLLTLLESRGVDMTYGAKLARLMREAGLREVSASASFPVTNPAGVILERANVAQTAPGLVKIGAATEAEISAHLAALDSGALDMTYPPMFTVIGRKA